MKNFLRLALILVAAFTMQINTSQAQVSLTQAVDFTATDTEGNTWNLFDVLDGGQYVVLDFWHTNWSSCGPAAETAQVAFEYFGCGDYDVLFFGINIGESNATCIPYYQSHGLTSISISGIEGGGTAIHGSYSPAAYPTFILIAPDHSIVEQDIWPIDPIISVLAGYGITPNDCDGGSPLTADFEADNTTVCSTNEVTFTNNSLGEITTYAWVFEGGDPTTSTEEHPVVSYNDNGVYDVTLTVSNDIGENTTVMEDYITVNEVMAIFEANETDICDLEQIQFTDNSLCATSWTWTFEGGDPATSTDQNPIVTYNTAGIFTVELTVSNESEESTTVDTEMITVHNCTGLAEYKELNMSITPNPSNGLFTIDFSAEDYYEVFVYDMTGHIVYDAKLSNNNNLLDLSHLENGIYIVKASNGMTQIKERVVIQK